MCNTVYGPTAPSRCGRSPRVSRRFEYGTVREITKQLTSVDDNRPAGVRHPLVTLVNMLDALRRRVPTGDASPTISARKFEDAAPVIRNSAKLPLLPDYASVGALAGEMVAQRQLVSLPTSSDRAFMPNAGERCGVIRAAHAAIAPMFWGLVSVRREAEGRAGRPCG